MLARQRQAVIFDQLRRSGGVRVSELVALLGVSDMTVRRDLEAMAAHGVAQKVHGGAVLGGRVSEEPGFEVKRALERPAKRAIAARAAAMVMPGTAIALSAGTTTWAMAQHLAAVPGLTVVTNSTTVADTVAGFGEAADRTLILTGGARTPSAALVGPVADLTIRSLHVDQLFLGAHGFDERAGFTTPNLAEAETNRALISRARQVVLLADSTKWTTVGLASFAMLGEADVLITDDQLDDHARAVVGNAVGQLVVVTPADSLP